MKMGTVHAVPSIKILILLAFYGVDHLVFGVIM
jgi:hypothetical protein